MDEINKFIDNVEGISKIRKDFYKKIIAIWYEILKSAYENMSIWLIYKSY